MVDFPERAHRSFWFLTEAESKVAVSRIQQDRGDVKAELFTWSQVLRHFADPKIYGFCCMFFLLVRVCSVEEVQVDTKFSDRILSRQPSPISYPSCRMTRPSCIVLPTHKTYSLQGGMGFSSDQAILLSAPVWL